MLRIEIREEACRGCQICVDICPTKALEYDEKKAKARIRQIADCIACLTCKYLCPSGAMKHEDYPVVRNFYRNLEFSQRMEKYL